MVAGIIQSVSPSGFLRFLFLKTRLGGTVSQRLRSSTLALDAKYLHFGLLGYPLGNAILTIEFHSKSASI